jgi:CRISPR-associated endonuclease/helicase Cas3
VLSQCQLWAKASAKGIWHALPFHLLDVAAAAEALWERLPHQANSLATHAFGDESTAKRICAFLAGTHDVGKANRYFQAKDRCQYARLCRLGVDLPPRDAPEIHSHGQATGAHLKPWLVDRWKWRCFTAETVALAVGGHHGSFFDSTGRAPLGVDTEPWAGFGRALLDALADVLLGPEPPREPTPLNPFLGWLAGFVSVADWLGSHESMTVWQTEERPLANYLAEARTRAQTLIDNLHWQAPRATTILPLIDLVPQGREPNSLQKLAAELAPTFSLTIVEAPTGEGKTEAAFALGEHGRSNGAGIFFALPTMATANGLYGRVEVYLRKAGGCDGLETRLLHSQAWLFREKVQTAADPGEEGRKQDAQAQDWFAGSKRGLLAPYGVGTIDQALVAALKAKHGFVRLFALAGKTVVIDEVHAYDVYMADLMDVLLGWLRALRCRVILLSATLPKARRHALLRAWGGQCDQSSSGYPCITWITEDGRVQSQAFDVQRRKPLTFQLLPAGAEEHWGHGASKLLQLVRAYGGLGALVLNTVRDAQRAYDWLHSQRLDNIHLELFHARFTAQDRDRIETRVLERFGKTGARKQPAIIVATQVVEQSLDLDFDHLVSALAPIDFLIQRAGRLHRHRRRADGSLCDIGPDQRPNPVLHVLAPRLGEDGLPDLRDPVYSHDVLMRTLQRLRSNGAIIRPSDVPEAIEAVYGEADRAVVLSTWEAKLKELEAKTVENTQIQRRQAERATIPHVDDPDKLIVESDLALDENDERQCSQLCARTRLEDRPSITVALLHEEDGRWVTIHGGEPANPRAAMFACVRVSPPFPLWEALLSIEPLPAWRRRGSLSQTRPLVLRQGFAALADYEIRYDKCRGLDWRKTNAVVQA